MKIAKTLLACALALSGTVSHAVTSAYSTTFGNILWSSSAPIQGLTTCTQIIVDATGDLNNSSRLSIYGSWNCGGGAYALTGSGYLGTNGTLNMVLAFGIGNQLQCYNFISLQGVCQVYNAAGTYLGNATLNLAQ